MSRRISGLSATTIPPRGSVSGTVTFICPSTCIDYPNPFDGTNYLTITSNDPAARNYAIELWSIPPLAR